MSRVGKTVLATVACLLAGTAMAPAREIARPVMLDVPYSDLPGTEPTGRLPAETRGGEQAGYLVIKRRNVLGERWLGIRIGDRPNNRTDWVERKWVYLVDARYSIHISVRQRTMAFFGDGKRLWKTPVVVGATETPTPRGLFAVHDFYRVFDDLRPWVIETSAHSEVHDTFLGGPARVAIHGRHGKLEVPWGIRASNGCIRTPNWALRSIRRLAPVGTPIRVR